MVAIGRLPYRRWLMSRSAGSAVEPDAASAVAKILGDFLCFRDLNVYNGTMTLTNLKALIPSDAMVEIPAGDYFVLPTAAMAAEKAGWPTFPLESEEGSVVVLKNGVVPRELFERACALLDDAMFSADSHGFRFGIAFRRVDEVPADVLDFLLGQNVIARHSVATDSLLIFPGTFDHYKAIGISEEAAFALVSDFDAIDAYAPLQALDAA